MESQIPVYLYAQDPITEAGLAAELRCRPDLTLVDESSPAVVAVIAVDTLDEVALTRIRTIRARGCPRVVLVVPALSDDDLLAVVESGACSVVWRCEASASWLAETVAKAACGEAALPSDVLSRLLKQVARLQQNVLRPRGLALNGLSDRERDVLRLAAEGFGTWEIAQKLAYSTRTVTNVLHDVMTRYQLRNRTHAVAYAIREGLI
jgi:DNA-binding NarL/FixJ family response regulator